MDTSPAFSPTFSTPIMDANPADSPASSPTISPTGPLGTSWAPVNLRASLIIGLFLQAFLIVYAPHRKRRSSKILTWLIWLAYFLADWTAGFALALISASGAELGEDNIFGINTDLLQFWAPFILIQLGGADTIISSKIQEHTLSSRGAWFFQVGLALYGFLVSFPNRQVILLWPKILLLVAGVARYAESGLAINHASLMGLKKSMLKRSSSSNPRPRNSSVHNSIHTGVFREGELKSDIAVVQLAHRFFQRSKGLLIGFLFSFEERRESRMLFQQATPEEAYKLIAVELNFMHDSLFTKALKVHSKMGYFIRTTSLCISVIALISLRKHENDIDAPKDIEFTYFLFYGAIVLDLISLLQHIFSDWTVVALGTYTEHPFVAFLFGMYLTLKRSSLASSTGSLWYHRISRIAISIPRTTISFRRWSKSVTTFSFLDYSIRKRSKICFPCYPACKKIQNMLLCKGAGVTPFGSSHQLTAELWNFIFMELKRKSMLSDIQIGTDIYRARGAWILRSSRWSSDCGHLQRYVNDYDYAQSILLWHIATEMCCINDKSDGDRRGHCKTLSCYMLYLLIQRPIAMSQVAGIFGEFALRDTSAEVQQFFTREGVATGLEAEEVFRKMFEAHSQEAKPVDDHVKGMKSISVLSDACALSKELMKLGETKWDLMSEVWVEMLSYAASHCEAKTHADFLTRGGELVTFVWLLMARLGIMEALVQTKEVDQSIKYEAYNEC